MSSVSPQKQNLPFGNPDGSRADIADIERGFVDFNDEIWWNGLAVRPDDFSARVIVGKKGSGKTLYLRRLRASAALEDSMYALDVEQNVPKTDSVVRFCQWFSKNTLTEKWIALWQRAIFCSLVSHFLANPDLKQNIPDDLSSQLSNERFRKIFRKFFTPMSVYGQVDEIINKHTSQQSIINYLNDPYWQDLEYIVAEILKSHPPIFICLDSVDEYFESAPMYWLNCQKGLFYVVMRLLRDSKFGSRLHLVVTIRDIVFSSVLQGENLTRYRYEKHIRILDWNEKAISYFFDAKIEQLDDSHFSGSTANGRTLYTWLARKEILNKDRGRQEEIKSYLLRHTRMLPRDIVILGNCLWEKSQTKRNSNFQLEEEDIREVVSECAMIFGKEQLYICASQISSNIMPPYAEKPGVFDFYIGNDDYVREIADDLIQIIKLIGKDHFSALELADAETLSNDWFADNIDVFSVMWQNGLIGYRKSKDKLGYPRFFSDTSIDHFKLPREAYEYVFHPCMIETAGILPVDSNPVIPWNRLEEEPRQKGYRPNLARHRNQIEQDKNTENNVSLPSNQIENDRPAVPNINPLRRILAVLYPDKQSIERLVFDGDINSSLIDFASGNSLNIWHSVLVEMHKVERINILIELVMQDYPTDKHFKEACDIYYQSINNQSTIE